MGATLANGGVNPQTGKRLLDEEYVPELLAIMLTAGFYDESGEWSFTTGLPAKPEWVAASLLLYRERWQLPHFLLDLMRPGTSIRATKAISYISNKFKLSIFEPG